jgi:HAD superfamily hydrolase (TIGR01509 family)
MTNIVFDLGKVLIEWDPRHLYRKVFNNAQDMEWFLAHVCTGAWNVEQDRGRRWQDAEAEAISRHPQQEANIRLFRARWIEMVPDAIAGSVQILEELQARGTPLYAITNWAGDTFRETRARFPFLDLFRDIVVSGDEGIIKPDAAIFELLCSRNGLHAGDCLFIDDSLKNVAGAEAAGWQGLHFTTPQALRADLAARGLL